MKLKLLGLLLSMMWGISPLLSQKAQQLERWAIGVSTSWECTGCERETTRAYKTQATIEYRLKKRYSLMALAKLIRSNRRESYSSFSRSQTLLFAQDQLHIWQRKAGVMVGVGAQYNLSFGRSELSIGSNLSIGFLSQRITIFKDNGDRFEVGYLPTAGSSVSAYLGYTYWPTKKVGITGQLSRGTYRAFKEAFQEKKDQGNNFNQRFDENLLPLLDISLLQFGVIFRI